MMRAQTSAQGTSRWTQILAEDCSGACLPGPPGSAADRLLAISVLDRRAPFLELLGDAAASAPLPERAALVALRDRVAALSPLDFVAAFRHPLAFGAVHRAKALPAAALAAELGRFLIGAPIDAPVSFVLPAAALAPAGLYLPHVHALVAADAGPVVVEADAERVLLRWPDGASATLPAGGVVSRAEIRVERLSLLPTVAGLAVLNGVPELARDPVRLLAPERAAPLELDTIEAGFELLQRVWPAAYHASRRCYRCVVVLRAPGGEVDARGEGAPLGAPAPAPHSRSITTGFLHGSFNASIHDAVQVADAICHEASHTRLNLFREIDPLLIDDGAEIHPSPWRTDPRPLKGVLDGVHAFLNVSLFYGRLRALGGEEGGVAARLFGEQRRKVLRAWEYLAPRAVPTALGAAFLADLGREVRALAAEPDPPRTNLRLPLFDERGGRRAARQPS